MYAWLEASSCVTSRKSRIVGFYTKRDSEFLSPERYLLPVRFETGVTTSHVLVNCFRSAHG